MPKKNALKWKQVIKLYKSGMPSEEVAKAVGYDGSNVRRILRMHGLMRSLEDAAIARFDRKGPRTISISAYGYRQYFRGNKRIYEHRDIAEQILGRALRSDETVHHKNGNKTDNRPENLEVISCSEHMRLHRKLCPRHRGKNGRFLR
jgi:hypothetical protein